MNLSPITSVATSQPLTASRIGPPSGTSPTPTPAGTTAPSPATAPAPSDAQRAAVAALAGMVGTWKGSGWIQMGPGAPQTFISQEIVLPKLDGQILSVEGSHLDPRPVHQTLGVISYDTASSKYQFKSWVEQGGFTDGTGQVVDGAFQWGFHDPRGSDLRFTIKADGTTWDEVGEISRDGNWNKFFGLTMKRDSSAPQA